MPRTASTYGLAALLALIGCGHEEPAVDAGAGPPARALPNVDDAMALTLPALREAVTDARAAAESDGATATDVRQAAALLRVLALREADGAHLRAARRLLEPWLGRSGPEACHVVLDLARLLARDAGDLVAARRVAEASARRFASTIGTSGDATSCARELERIAAVLEGVPTAAGDEVARFAEGRDDTGDGARLERLLVYGEAGENADGVRAVLTFDRVAVFREGELAAEGDTPRRVFLDFANTTADASVPTMQPVDLGGLFRVRRGVPAPGTTRVVFDLADQARAQLFFLTDPYRVVVDIAREARGPTRGPVRVVVLDPGHGGNEFGARFDGLRESEVVLDVTQRAARALERLLPGVRVLLTRHRDEVISLEKRTAMANAVDADVFVSVHLNAADEPVDKGGVTTFVLDTTNNRQALRLAARENGTSTMEVTGLQRILADLHRAEQSTASRALAEALHGQVLLGGRQVLPRLADRGVRQAMFYVLVGARMPAVLLEASFMTKPEEAAALKTPRYRQALAEGIAAGIARYATTR